MLVGSVGSQFIIRRRLLAGGPILSPVYFQFNNYMAHNPPESGLFDMSSFVPYDPELVAFDPLFDYSENDAYIPPETGLFDFSGSSKYIPKEP